MNGALSLTVVKQVTVKSRSHLKRLESYLDWDRGKVLDHGTQNLTRTESARSCMREMDATREAYGHNRPGKANCACRCLEHQCLAFNPDECDVNGGVMTPLRCMEYARDYVAARYPNQECFWVLHKERCKTDGVERYAVHVAINRTDLETGRRLDEGGVRAAARARVKTVRELDERYGLRQLERGSNAKKHARQPSRAEREWQRRDRSHRSENDRVRERIAVRADEVSKLPSCDNRPRELARRLAQDGITMTLSKGGDTQFRYKSQSLKRSDKGVERRINGSTLGGARSRSGRTMRFDLGSIRTAIALARVFERIAEDATDDGRGG